jgi:iron complex outermembrane receptor protein
VETFESPTSGYALFDIGFGGELSLGTKEVEIDCTIENLFNRAYRDHLSRYKEYALNPGIGISLRAAMPFAIIE